MKRPLGLEVVGSRFIQNISYVQLENSSKLLIFHFEILQRLYFSKLCGFHVNLAQL